MSRPPTQRPGSSPREPDGSTLAGALALAERALRALHDTARLDAELLLCATIERERHYAYAWPESRLSAEQQATFESLVERRLRGEPVAYLVGRRHFWSFELEVTPHTLIPRPETECLVDAALSLAPSAPGGVALDLGTGSGAVALAFALERQRWRVVATDISTETLAVTRRNSTRLEIGNVELRTGSWFEPTRDEHFDLIVSNPPYVADGDAHLGRGDVRFEPRQALASGADGLSAIRTIAGGARSHLTPGGWLVLEHGYDQGPRVRALLGAAGYEAVETRRDLAARERVTFGRA